MREREMQQVPGWIRIGDIVVHGLGSARNCRFFTQLESFSKCMYCLKVVPLGSRMRSKITDFAAAFPNNCQELY